MKVKEDKIKKEAKRLVNSALNDFESFKDSTEDIIDQSGDEYCVNIDSIANYDQGDTDKDALNNLDEFVDGIDEEIEHTDEDFLNESVDEATGMVSDALNETPEAKSEGITFDFMTEEGTHNMRACMTKEAFEKKFGKKPK